MSDSAPSRSWLKAKSNAFLVDFCHEKNLPVYDTDKKQQMVDRLCNYYKIPLGTPAPSAPAVISDRKVELLETEIGISKASVEEILKAGFKSVDRLMRISDSSSFPGNLSFITLLSDRVEVELLISKKGRKALSTDSIEGEVEESDLRQLLNRSRQQSVQQPAQGGSRSRRRERPRHPRSASKSRSSSSRSRSVGKLAELSKVANKLPRAHKFVTPRVALKSGKKLNATDLSVDDLLAYDMRVCVRLAEKVNGDYAQALLEYLEYHEFLITMRCNYTDDSILRFDDDFRRTALSEKVELSDERYRKILADRYFHFDARGRDSWEHGKSQLFRGKGYNSKYPKYRLPCCWLWQDSKCPKTAGACPHKHFCGNCGGEHKAPSCTVRYA